MMLGDLGADVLRVELTEGSEARRTGPLFSTAPRPSAASRSRPTTATSVRSPSTSTTTRNASASSDSFAAPTSDSTAESARRSGSRPGDAARSESPARPRPGHPRSDGPLRTGRRPISRSPRWRVQCRSRATATGRRSASRFPGPATRGRRGRRRGDDRSRSSARRGTASSSTSRRRARSPGPC